MRLSLPEHGGGERRAAARGVAWSGVESAVAAIVGLFLTPLVLRSTGVTGLGLWGAAWSLAHTASIVDLGVGSAYGRFAARALARHDFDELNATLAVGVGFQGAVSLTIAALALFFGPALLDRVLESSERPAGTGVVLGLTLATVLLRNTLSAYRGVVAGAQRLDLLARIGALGTLSEGLLGAFLLSSGLGLTALGCASLACAIAVTAAEAIAAHRLVPALRVRPFHAGRVHTVRVLSFGGQVQVTRAFEVLSMQAPRLILAAGPGLAAAGAYDLAARLAGLSATLANLPLKILMPLAGHLDARGDARRLSELLRRTTRYVALLALPPITVVLLAPDALLAAWTGRAAPPGSAAAARLLALAAGAALLASPLRLVLRALGRAGLEASATTSGALVQMPLAVLFAASYGAPGAAAAALLGSLAAFLLITAFGWHGDAGVSTPQAARAAAAPLLAAAAGLAAGLLAAAALPALPAIHDRASGLQALALRVPALALIFLATAWLCRAAAREDFDLLREVAGPWRRRVTP
ncbi:MAG TPA: oligosaccharide flippase family protein [Candidatus Polarisedimenticolia bacterium]|jgi:O-antigen/teichoic acid export membrane protein|nr:oligosaccharide flippase family protein [Candidatus Polarisedimenticolia bacterium]